MTLDKVNYLNIALMLLASAVAIWAPFELFLFSYAVLGPLHYFTEIVWLDKRNYFMPDKPTKWALFGFAALILLPTLLLCAYQLLPNSMPIAKLLMKYRLLILPLSKHSILYSFIVSIIVLLVRKNSIRLIMSFLAIALVWLLHSQKIVNIVATLFIPTIIHVYFFTGAFMLSGALKSKSVSAIQSVILYVLLAVVLLSVGFGGMSHLSMASIKVYSHAFHNLNAYVYAIYTHSSPQNGLQLYNSTAGILIMRFIAFAFTYHYLNWFSKTSIIKWHETSKLSIVMILVFWLTAVGIYLMDYKLGFIVLYFISLLHVILEFPLNVQSFIDIRKHLKNIKAIYQ